MSAAFDVVVLVGSLRKESFTRKTAKALTGLAPERLKLRIVEVGDLPLYNQDLDTAEPPPAWQRFRNDIRPADAVLFATPEYNRSVPGLLKNAIDVGSRPSKQSVFAKKPAAVVSISLGAISGFGANHHLRQSLVFLDMPTLQQPEVYLAHADKLFDAQGALINQGTAAFLQQFLTTFAAWIERVGAQRG